ncbi:MAG TPA: UDP-glucose/GDP-mannose dehydrogenase family protein, partial [Alphaproteobacteria bacterium]|nr:UDP-glucose/GDP-mannose dehydrogenase family protein [Alphaproteobacteria bacterium]
FCCIPENLRLGQAIESFFNPDRIVVGIRDNGIRPILERLLSPISSELVWVGVESAEMSKHALNAFLAMSIVYSNEIAGICERVNADVREVEKTLRTESRVGRSAYIRPGEAFSGGTLARDVTYLTNIADQQGLRIPVLNSVIPSNNIQKGWLFRRAQEILGNSAQDKKVGVLGVSYKVGTDSIRRSGSIELMRGLLTLGVQISAFDPKVNVLPKDLSMVRLENTIDDVTVDSDLLILVTQWPDFQTLSSETLINNMRTPVVIDQSEFLAPGLSSDSRIQYITFGKG